MELNIWKTFSSKIKRLLTILMFFIVSLAITIAGVLTPLTHKEATEINDELKQMQENVLSADMFHGTTLIFGNNFVLCLSFFIPFFGPLFGCYVLYSTGVWIAAQSISKGVNPTLTFMFLFIFPFTWLEFLAYSAAFAQSAWLSWHILKHDFKKELTNTCIMISVCAITLLVAAAMEMAIIKAFAQASLHL